MTKNKLSDVRDHLFMTLERLNDEETIEDKEKLELEIRRATAIKEVAQTIVDSGKVEVMAIKAIGGTEPASDFFDNKQKQLK